MPRQIKGECRPCDNASNVGADRRELRPLLIGCTPLRLAGVTSIPAIRHQRLFRAEPRSGVSGVTKV